MICEGDYEFCPPEMLRTRYIAPRGLFIIWAGISYGYSKPQGIVKIPPLFLILRYGVVLWAR
jgi:hypothetical protein